MPLVRIDLPLGFSDERIAAIGDAVHQALIEAIRIPVADRFQVITEHAPARLVMDPYFGGTHRSEDAFIIQITLRAGRADDLKRGLYAAITRRLSAIGIRPQDVMVVLAENGPADWAFADGVALYAPAEQVAA